MNNPLLNSTILPSFDQITASHVEPAITLLLTQARQGLDQLLAEPSFDWSWYQQLETLDEKLNQAWSPVSHLNSVASTPELRAAHDAMLPLLSAYTSERGQNVALMNAFKTLAKRDDGSVAQREAVRQALLEFQLAGIDLPEDQQARVAELKQSLSQLSSRFSNNVLDATEAWFLHITEESCLSGLPAVNIELAETAAKKRNLEGWVLTLDMPQYIAVMTFLDDAGVREIVYRAFVSRASDTGPHDSKFDNTAIMHQILTNKTELARLLGFANYAELSLAKKMADHPDSVSDFIHDLAIKSKPQAQSELNELTLFAQAQGVDKLNPWDVTYWGEKRREALFNVSQEALKPYFPIDSVLSGLFNVVNRLFNIEVRADLTVKTYHDDVVFYRIYRAEQEIAGFYFDLYSRDGKRGGAWMDECRVRRAIDNGIQLPVAYMVCNFTAPTQTTPSLLTHQEVTTLFHEFGHGLHHMLSEVEVAAVSGINGVVWDAVELPSQFLENWCWEPEVVEMLSSHYQTGESLPKQILDSLLAAKNYQSAMMMMRQLEFAAFDFELHRKTKKSIDILDHARVIREQFSVVPSIDENRFSHSFSHIFAGGYAAGYYSYKWAEVLSADAFSLFEERGLFDQESGQKFLTHILQKGGEEPAAVLYQRYRGRDADLAPLLRHSGIEVK